MAYPDMPLSQALYTLHAIYIIERFRELMKMRKDYEYVKSAVSMVFDISKAAEQRLEKKIEGEIDGEDPELELMCLITDQYVVVPADKKAGLTTFKSAVLDTYKSVCPEQMENPKWVKSLEDTAEQMWKKGDVEVRIVIWD